MFEKIRVDKTMTASQIVKAFLAKHKAPIGVWGAFAAMERGEGRMTYIVLTSAKPKAHK